MINFKTVIGTQVEKPEAYDFTGSPGKVYVRKNIKRTTETVGEDTIEVWKYDEALMTYEDFAAYSQAEMLNNQEAQDQTLAEVLLNTL